MTAAAFFLGLGLGIVYVAILMHRSYGDELRERDAWEREARDVLREVVRSVPSAWMRRRAADLLSDEAGA